MQEENKLGYILFQFPPWIEKSRETMEYLSWLRENIKGTLAIEFRHHSWLSEENRDDTFCFLRKERLAYTCVDEPQLPWTVPPIVEVTTPELITRFHGRNKPAGKRRSTRRRKICLPLSKRGIKQVERGCKEEIPGC